MRSTLDVHMNEGDFCEAHNYREIVEPHIDPNGVHEIWKRKTMYEVYNQCFGKALAEKNAKQKRKDRHMTIEQYMDSVKNDKRGRKPSRLINGKRVRNASVRQGKRLGYELIYRASNTERLKDEKGNIVYDDTGHHIRPEELPYEVRYRATKRTIESFEAANSCLVIKDAVWHDDEGFYNKLGFWEKANSHCHLVVVPIGHGYKGDMSTQSSIGRALAEMGYIDKYTEDGRWVCAYEQFLEAERTRYQKFVEEEYENYCKAHPDYAKENGGFERYRPVKDRIREGGRNKEEYAEYQELLEDIADAKDEQKVIVKNQKSLMDKIDRLDSKRRKLWFENQDLAEEAEKARKVINKAKRTEEEICFMRRNIDSRELKLIEQEEMMKKRMQEILVKEASLKEREEEHERDLHDLARRKHELDEREKKITHFERAKSANDIQPERGSSIERKNYQKGG